MHDEPSWTVRYERRSDSQKRRDEDLDGNGNAPGSISRDVDGAIAYKEAETDPWSQRD